MKLRRSLRRVLCREPGFRPDQIRPNLAASIDRIATTAIDEIIKATDAITAGIACGKDVVARRVRSENPSIRPVMVWLGSSRLGVDCPAKVIISQCHARSANRYTINMAGKTGTALSGFWQREPVDVEIKAEKR